MESTDTGSAAIVNSTLVTMELEQKKRSLNQYILLADQLRAANETLKKEMAAKEKEFQTVTEALKAELGRKQDQVLQLTSSLREEKSELEAHWRRREMTFHVEVESKDGQLLKTQSEIMRLQGELAAVAQFKRERAEMEAELRRLRESEAQLKERYEAELSRVRFVNMEDRVRLKAEEQALTQRFQQEVESHAYGLLDEKMKAIYRQNTELLADKQLLERELGQLSAMMKTAEEGQRRKQRDLELHEQSEQMYAKQGYRLQKEIRELTAANAQLKEALNRASAQA
eukprot:RCo027531